MDLEHTVRRPHEGPKVDRTCPVCGTDHVTTFVHRDTFDYGTGESAVSLHVDLPVRRCAECDFEFLDHEAEQLRHDTICNHLGVLTSTEIRAIRKQHGMTRSSFAEITGLGEATLNRWENGVVIQNPANDRYLRLLAIPDVFGRLADLPTSPSSRVNKPVSKARIDRRDNLRKTAGQHPKTHPHASNAIADPHDDWKSRRMSNITRPPNLIRQVHKRINDVTKNPAQMKVAESSVVEDQKHTGSTR